MMKHHLSLCAAASLAIGLSGCGVLQPAPPPSSPRAEPPRSETPRPESRPDISPRISESEQLSTLIGYVQNVSAMPADDQRRELSGANQAFGRESSPLARLKLAMLLCLPGTVIADDGRALSLLEPMAAGTAGPAGANAGALRRFAGLLHAQVGERVREQKRSAQLREQLDALKAMERSLMERSQGRGR
jgi:hypothetical protein